MLLCSYLYPFLNAFRSRYRQAGVGMPDGEKASTATIAAIKSIEFLGRPVV